MNPLIINCRSPTSQKKVSFMTPKQRSSCYIVSSLWQFNISSIFLRITTEGQCNIDVQLCSLSTVFPTAVHLNTWTKPTKPVFQARRLQTHPELTASCLHVHWRIRRRRSHRMIPLVVKYKTHRQTTRFYRSGLVWSCFHGQNHKILAHSLNSLAQHGRHLRDSRFVLKGTWPSCTKSWTFTPWEVSGEKQDRVTDRSFLSGSPRL